MPSSDAPRTILHLGKYYPPARGGVEAHVQTLARGQAALGCTVRVLCVNHALRNGIDATWSPLGRTVTTEEYDSDVSVVRLGRSGSIAKLDVTFGVLHAIRRLASGADVVHLHAPNPLMMLALSAWRRAPTIVVTWHSDVVRQRLRGVLLRPLEEDVLRRADLILSSTQGYIDGSRALLQYRDKVQVLPLGLDLRPYAAPSAHALEERDRLVERHGSPLWLAVGRLVYYKGLDTAIDALRWVPGKLLIVGTGPEEGRLRNRALKQGVADRIAWLGQASPALLQGAYHGATALWFPSNARSEAFGQVQVEAMASGCPVINTAIPGSGVSWVSLDGLSGITVPVNDGRALAAAANSLLDHGLRARLSEGGERRAAAEFDERIMARRSLLLYESLRRRPSESPAAAA